MFFLGERMRTIPIVGPPGSPPLREGGNRFVWITLGSSPVLSR